jgi:hypothetical protein
VEGAFFAGNRANGKHRVDGVVMGLWSGRPSSAQSKYWGTLLWECQAPPFSAGAGTVVIFPAE